MEKLNKAEMHEIFQRMKYKNKQATEELYTEYQPLVISIAFSIVKNREVAEEISQNVFFKIMNLPADKLPSQKEFTWLYTVTKNEAMEYFRKQNYLFNIDDLYDIENPNNEIDEVIDIETFHKLIDCLTNQEKEIVSLKIIGNLTFQEIGHLLNMPIGTVQWKYYQSVHALKIALSNLAMFMITITLYVVTKTSTTRQNIEQDNRADSMIDSLVSSVTDNMKSDTSSIENAMISSPVEIGVFSVASAFLVITIIFAIIFAKRQQKRQKKSSK